MGSSAIQVRESDVLLVVDLQNDFCPGGALGVDEGDQIVPLANRLMRRFPHVVFTQDWHPAGHTSFASSHEGKKPFDTIQLSYGEQILWPDHCVPGSHGAQFHPELNTAAAELILRKGFDPAIDSYSAFFENDHEKTTGLTAYLRERGLSRVFIIGLAADFCVQYSALDGIKQDFAVIVIEDGVRGIDLEGSLSAAWQAMQKAGVMRVRESDLEFGALARSAMGAG